MGLHEVQIKGQEGGLIMDRSAAEIGGLFNPHSEWGRAEMRSRPISSEKIPAGAHSQLFEQQVELDTGPEDPEAE